MGNVKFSDLSALTALADDDLSAWTDDSEDGAEKSKKVKATTLRDYILTLGEYNRAKFVYKDADEIYINAGFYDVDGKYSIWSSQLTKQLTSAAASTMYYLYLDHSEITSGTALTATEFLFSTTAPTWSDAKHGFYNGSDRCCFYVYTDGSSNIREFFHDGDNVFYANGIADRAAGIIVFDTWTDVTLKIPSFARGAIVTARYYWDKYANTGELSWRTNGQSGTTGHRVLEVNVADNQSRRANSTFLVITDSSQIVEFKSTAASSGLGVTTQGWHLPEGM